MTGADEALRDLVGAALPRFAEFELENFAGDPLVKEFADEMRSSFDLPLSIWVSWACPPDTIVLRSPLGNALIRSERFDSLLIEFFDLKRLVLNPAVEAVKKKFIQSAVARWQTEFFIGYRMPLHAFDALDRVSADGIIFDTRPFRDDNLDSMPPIERAALQCFCLGHEMGHVIAPERADTSLEDEVDGISLMRHLTRNLEVSGIDQQARATMVKILNSEIDPDSLLGEIDADLIAFGAVARFVEQALGCERKAAIHATLAAFQAQCFIYQCKLSCLRLKQHHFDQVSEVDFQLLEWVDYKKMEVRARCVMRRAGMLWKHWDKLDGTPSNSRASYVQRVDAMYLEDQELQDDMGEAFMNAADEFFALRPPAAPELRRSELEGRLNELAHDADRKLRLFYILVAMGLPGGTDVVKYMESLGDPPA